jgi:enterochelin esterase-like enzyme
MGNGHLFISLVFIIATHICPAQTDSAFSKADSVPAFHEPPAGFDVQRNNIPTGKLTVVQYQSKTIGKLRQMNVYTPPGYSSHTYCICCTVWGKAIVSGLNGARPITL